MKQDEAKDKDESTDSLTESEMGDVINEDEHEDDGSSTSSLVESEGMGEYDSANVKVKPPAKKFGSDTSSLQSEDLDDLGSAKGKALPPLRQDSDLDVADLSHIDSDDDKKAKSAPSDEEEKKESLPPIQDYDLDLPLDTEATVAAGDQSFTKELGYDDLQQVHTPHSRQDDAY